MFFLADSVMDLLSNNIFPFTSTSVSLNQRKRWHLHQRAMKILGIRSVPAGFWRKQINTLLDLDLNLV